jgi:hypothetical protein
MKIILIISLLYFGAWSNPNEKERTITYEGQEVHTTYGVSSSFIGTYKGNKTGYLMLNEDGTGLYKYDIFGFAPKSCKNQPIQIEWGFLLKKEGGTVKFDREYGFSYPILLKSTSDTSFQGCRESVLLDFILEYEDGSLGVSSSDNWKK